MKSFTAELFTKPVPKARARVLRSGHSFTPQKSKDAEDELKQFMTGLWKGPPLEVPVSVQLVFQFAHETRRFQHVMRPDIDNLMKQVMDAGNGLLWKDDGLIWEIRATKYWSKQDKITLVMTWEE